MGVHAVFDPRRFERNFVRGDWVFSRFGYQFDIYDPSNSDVIAAVPLSTRFDVRETVAAAREAAPGWASLPGWLRVDHLLNAIERIERNIEEIAALEARDTGAPVAYVLGCLSSALLELPVSSKTSRRNGRSARGDRGDPLVEQSLPGLLPRVPAGARRGAYDRCEAFVAGAPLLFGVRRGAARGKIAPWRLQSHPGNGHRRRGCTGRKSGALGTLVSRQSVGCEVGPSRRQRYGRSPACMPSAPKPYPDRRRRGPRSCR